MPEGFNEHYGGASIYVDISDLEDTIDEMKRALSVENFEEMMRRTFNDAGKKVKTIMRREVPKDYAVTAGWVGSHVGWPERDTGRRIGVIVPIKGKRGTLGGTYTVTGARGRPRKGEKPTMYASLIKGQKSKLPGTYPHQGGNAGFKGPNGVLFTRKYKDRRLPIVRLVGLGVPQMPLNLSEENVQDAIKDVVVNRLQHHFEVLFKKQNK